MPGSAPQSSGAAPLSILQVGTSIAVSYCCRMLAVSGYPVAGVGGAPAGLPPAHEAVHAYLQQGKQWFSPADGEPEADLIGRLLEGASVIVADRTLDELGQLGLAVDPNAAAAAGRVVVSVTPWGSNGPPAMRKAGDLHLFHGGGLGAMTPRFANNPSEPPLRLGYPLAEFLTGLTAAASTMAGINHLRETGSGSVIDVSGQQAIAHAESIYLASYTYEQRNSSRVSRPGLAPFHFLPCADGHVMIICPEEHQWRSLVDLMGNPEWAEAEVFATSASRALYWDAIEPQVVEWLAGKTKQELYHLAQAKRIPLAPVNNADAVLEWQHLAERGFFQPLQVGERVLKAPGMPFGSSHAKTPSA